jgi:hypothetical protein
MTEVELKAIGPQDKFLTVQPQISYFKTVFRRHTNFSRFTKSINKNSSSPIKFGMDSLEYRVGQEGDLLSKMYFEVIVKGTGDGSQVHTVNHFGNSLIKTVELNIGGFTIDIHTGTWLQVESELTEDRYKYPLANQSQTDSSNGGLSVKLIDANDNTTNRNVFDISRRVNGDGPLVFGGQTSDGDKVKSKTYFKKFYIPLKFFFNKNLSQALPLCALSKHEVKIQVSLETEDNLRGTLDTGDLSIESMELFGEFIRLDTEEKTKFINTTLSYLIENVQVQSSTLPETVEQNPTFNAGYDNITDKVETALKTFELDTLKHPVKYIAWVVVNPGTNGSNGGQGPCYFMSLCSNSEYGSDGIHGSVRIDLDGSEKEPTLPMSIYTRKNPMKYCKYVPELDRIGMYSFAEAPFETQPSGTCNFSKLREVDFHMKFANDAINGGETILKGKTIHFFAVNYNVLRIANGMAGLEFS